MGDAAVGMNNNAAEIQHLESVLEAAMTATADIAVITDAAQAIIYASASFTAMTGYGQAELLGRNCRFLQGPGTDADTVRVMRDVLTSEESFDGEILNYRKNGSPFWTALKIIPMRVGTRDAVTHYVSVQRDISNRVALLQQLQVQSVTDAVTGLPNRKAAERAVEAAVERAIRPDTAVAVGLLDLDDFRLVNNAFGHGAGDDVLRQWATRILSCLREGDLLARMGGDEFLLILKDIDRGRANDHLMDVLGRIEESADQPYTIGDQSVRVGMSLGIALVPEDGTDSRSILRSANEALHSAKQRHPGGRWWETAQNASVQPQDNPTNGGSAPLRGTLPSDYRDALNSGDIAVHFQPVVDLRDGSVHLFEALARLSLPGGRIAYPDEFLPHFTSEDLLVLFAGVLDRALATLAAWDQTGSRHDVSVNLPPAVLTSGSLSTLVQTLLQAHTISPQRLGLELLESQDLHLEEQRTTLRSLIDVGVGLAMDDLGSGYSSLQRLSSFPFGAIKLDRGLYHHVRDRPVETLSIIATLIQMGRDLRMNVVVEGLENESLAEATTVLGAFLGQGYYFAKPMPAQDCLRWAQSFTLQEHLSPVRTPLGALAYHWQFARLAAPHPLDLDRCPLTHFINGAASPAEASVWHAQQHRTRTPGPSSSQFLIDWLTLQIRESEL